MSRSLPVCVATIATLLVSTTAAAQERRALVFGTAGYASIGHDDSQQGRAAILGGGAAFHLTPRLLVDADVHRARVEQVFGRERHDFTTVTFTGSLLFRSSPRAPVHFLAGGGWGFQRAHTEFDELPIGRIDEVETLGLWHGRLGAEWDASSRVAIRTEAVLWFGEGLDWIAGARVGLGYRF